MMQKLQNLEWIAWLPALSVAVLVRRDIGQRILHRGYITGSALIIAAIGLMIQPRDGQDVMLLFAGVVFVIGFARKFKAWWDFNHHKKHHSYSLGTSPFASRRLPESFRRKRIMERFFDPLFFMLLGGVSLPVYGILSVWLMVAGCFLLCVEESAYRRWRVMQMDAVDGLVFADHQGETVERFESAPASQHRQPSKAPIATGLGDDIARKIAEKRRNQ